jgi:hypothetical protein
MTLEMIQAAAKKARQYAVPKFTVNGKQQYIYLPKLKRWASVLDNIKAS